MCPAFRQSRRPEKRAPKVAGDPLSENGSIIATGTERWKGRSGFAGIESRTSRTIGRAACGWAKEERPMSNANRWLRKIETGSRPRFLNRGGRDSSHETRRCFGATNRTRDRSVAFWDLPVSQLSRQMRKAIRKDLAFRTSAPKNIHW